MDTIEFSKRNFFNTAVADIYRAIDGGSYTGSFILTFCLIDYLTWLELGHTKDLRNNYIKWVEKRLVPINIFYTNKGHELYSVRCALVHTYGPSNEMTKEIYEGYDLRFENVGMHLQKVNNNILKLCLYTMLTETVYTAHLFFEELIHSQNTEVKNRLDKQIQLKGLSVPSKYSEMHTALSVFDTQPNISLRDIQADYSLKILWKRG